MWINISSVVCGNNFYGPKSVVWEQSHKTENHFSFIDAVKIFVFVFSSLASFMRMCALVSRRLSPNYSKKYKIHLRCWEITIKTLFQNMPLSTKSFPNVNIERKEIMENIIRRSDTIENDTPCKLIHLSRFRWMPSSSKNSFFVWTIKILLWLNTLRRCCCFFAVLNNFIFILFFVD